jgi:DNA helicase-2/ATP-dependent DNA helicase PcrA
VPDRPASPPSTAIDFQRELNPEQLAAVLHGDGPQLVLAGAGSGKTRVITYRVAWLVRERGVDPGSIVAVTFTNKAAAEMRDRVERLVDLFPLPTFVGTFHRYALTLLRRYGDRVGLARDFSILDTDDQKRLMVQAMQAEGIPETSFPPRTLLAAVSSAKNRLLTPQEYEKTARDFFEQRVARAYRRYQSLLQQASGVDFDDMMSLSVRLLREHADVADRLRARVRHLLVDEFQDTNQAQLTLIELLAGKNGNLTAVGDEDQGIYRWRGADLGNILDFESHFPGAVARKLERNYRSTAVILDAANAVVSNNRLRRGKKLWTAAGRGEPIALHRAGDEGEEAAWVVERITALQTPRDRHPLSEVAILVRTNAQTRAFEDEFFRNRIPYTMVGGVRFYERAEIKDLVAYLRLLRNPRDTFSFTRILNTPPRGIGRNTVSLLEERAATMGATPWDVLELDSVESFPPRAATALRGFRELIRELRVAAAELPLPALLDELLAKTRYTEMYRREQEEEAAKLENIKEFLSAAQTFTEQRSFSSSRSGDADSSAESDDDLLTAFLDHVALVSDLDGWDGERGVTLMTLHSAKGLEFPIVFLPGLEDGLLPHFNAQGRAEDLEEERRLFYVGMTRAEKRLFLSTCRRRRIAGAYQDQRESPLLEEVPEGLLDVTESPRIYASERTRGIDEFYNRTPPVQPLPAVGAPRGVATAADAAAGRGPRRGSRVRHPTLGQGVVLELEGSGDDAKYTIFFERAGKKKLIAKYASLETL